MAIVLLATLTLATVYYAVHQNAAERLQQKTEALSQQLVGQLIAELEKHGYLPELLGQAPAARALLASATPDPERLAAFNRTLETANRIARTADIYLMRADGMTIAASNWNTQASFIGKNFAFRQYFQQAMQGQLGRYYALGTTSKKRGYYFAHAIPDAQGKPLGVMVVKVDINTQEAQWQQDSAEFMVTDLNGVVFMSSQEAWRLQTLQPLSALTQAALFHNQRYDQQALNPLPWRSRIDPALELQRVDTGTHDYLVHKRAMPFIDWNVYILTDWRSVTRPVVVTVAMTAFMLLLTLLLVYVLWKNQRQRREYEQKAREDLEAKVAERTRELQHTQEELVQAAKMAALGQLSAGINHELNNPLTAIRAYADNATQFLAIGKPEMAHHNLLEIVSLTERMATITRQLKTFSRKSAGQIETCDLHWALDSALSIVQPKLAQTRIVLEQQRDPATRYVQADLVWLEQILVNLISNAAEAVEEQAEPRVWVTLQAHAGQVDISVRDNGTGISEAAMPHVFEAFFTTKIIGKGLGLGLSISYRLARDMNGQLRVANAPQGGAIFTLTLQQAAAGETE
ncbi:sensor histidine kinase [Thiothrix subterranea]|uniref:ATP-binding protein n=1 Tax=Thiothrix subterranea TaxID=2735563 RepID=UPI00192BF60B|nr:ATP-binding protein [Thiothrix subterranea]QQZ28706.1 sensor histidine kinase [Thiothrix subterranea]